MIMHLHDVELPISGVLLPSEQRQKKQLPSRSVSCVIHNSYISVAT